MYQSYHWRAGLALCAVVLGLGVALLGNITPARAQEAAQWAHSFASSQDIEMTSMSLSVIGEVFIAGTFHGTVDFDPGPGETLLTSGSSDTSFIAKYTPQGALVWAYRLVGSGDIVINDIVVDPMSQIGVIGSFEGTADLDPGVGVHSAVSKGGHDIFLLRLLPDGNLQWAWTAGDEDDDKGYAIAADSRSSLYVTGMVEGRIFFQSGASPIYELEGVGGTDIFVARFNNAGTLFWVRVFGGEDDDVGTDLALDRSANVYLVGTFEGEADLDPVWTSFEARSHGRDDIFVSVLNDLGAALFQTYMGGAGNETNPRIWVQQDGAFLVSGEFEQSANFNVRGGNGVVTSKGQRDIFLARFAPPPARNFEFAFGLGGPQNETLAGIAQDNFGFVYLLGTFGDRVDFDPRDGVSELTSSGGEDIFLAKYNGSGEFQRVQGMINSQNDRARALAIHSSNNVVIGGEFSGTLDLGSGLTINTGQPDGAYSMFVARYARDVWTYLPERAFIPSAKAVLPAE